MSDLNVVAICGRLTRKPELKYGASGNAYCKFSIANNVWKGKENGDKANFFNVTTFGKQAENIEQYLDKGSQVVINGQLDHSVWEDKDGNKRHSVGIIANSVQFVGGKGKGGTKDPTEKEMENEPPPEKAERESMSSEKSASSESTFEAPTDDDDDIPF